MHFKCVRNHIFFVHFIMLHMKQLNSNKTRLPRFDKILVIQPVAEIYGESNERQFCSEIGLNPLPKLWILGSSK